MARVLSSRAAVLARRLGAQPQLQPQPVVVLSRRHNHTRRPAAEGLEEDAAGPSAPAADASALSRRLEEAIDSAMARAAEPDWAPFRPGTSYFVPPRPAGVAQGILALIGHGGGHIGSSASPRRGLSTDEARAVVADSRGYPCSTYFIKGNNSTIWDLHFAIRICSIMNRDGCIRTARNQNNFETFHRSALFL